jgi:hypothetical protein
MRLFWESPVTRKERGWTTWRLLLAARLPDTWDNAQVRLVARLGTADPDVRTGVVGDILERRGEMTRHVNVLGHLAAEHAEWLAAQLLAQDFADPRSSAGLSSVDDPRRGSRDTARRAGCARCAQVIICQTGPHPEQVVRDA